MKKNKNENILYFEEKEEKAVLDYINATSLEEKNRIYNEVLIEPFKIMIQSILRVYPIYLGSYEMEEIEANALAHLIDKMVGYDPNRITKKGEKAKAYSYCQTIIRNFYRDHSKNNYKEKKMLLWFDDYADEFNDNPDFMYELKFENQHNLENLINDIIIEIENKIVNDNHDLKKNEIIVGDAIINILKNWNILFMEETPNGHYDKKVTNKFAKNKILLFLKEQTGLSAKEIRVSMKPFKDMYLIKKINYLDE